MQRLTWRRAAASAGDLWERFCTRQRGWLTSELVAMADEGQAPFSAVPPSSLSRSTALFWARAAYATPSNKSLAGNYSPVQPLITSGGRLVGHVVMWCSRAVEYWTVTVCYVEQCGSTGIVHWTEALLVTALRSADALCGTLPDKHEVLLFCTMCINK